jgi:phage baseplate assembly protein W
MAEETFLGTGWGFPPTFDKNSKSVDLIADEEDIRSAIFIIMGTKVGERVMRRDFGSNLGDMVFEALNVSNIAYMKTLVDDGLSLFEPRINVDSVEIVQPDPGVGLVEIIVDYTVRSSNNSSNIVYPFYLSETSAP